MTSVFRESRGAAAPAARFVSEAARWSALRRRDPAADGRFFYSVKTTGVFCRPSCAARSPRPENVRFHDSAAAALQAGFRPCQRCRPDLPPRAERDAAIVARACRLIDAAERAPALRELAAASGTSEQQLLRLFKRVTGVTPKSYALGRRQRELQQKLAGGASVTTALYDAGFGSSGRFYESADGALGMLPSAYRNRGAGETICYATAPCSLGRVLVAAAARGICAIWLGDKAQDLVLQLKTRFSRALLRKAPPGFDACLKEVVRFVDDPAGRFDLPLDIRGTAFQRRVWKALRTLPAGTTVSYKELAARLGQPLAVRAVAAACAANTLAIAVPCHRVVATDGRLCGYRWGVERKRRLLQREKS